MLLGALPFMGTDMSALPAFDTTALRATVRLGWMHAILTVGHADPARFNRSPGAPGVQFAYDSHAGGNTSECRHGFTSQDHS